MDSCGESFFFYGLFFYLEFLALASSATNPVQQLIFLSSISADGKESPLPFWGPNLSFGFYLLPSCVRRPEWGHQVQTSVGLHCDPHSFLTVILATVNSNTRIVVILFLSSQWDTTWQYDQKNGHKCWLKKITVDASFHLFTMHMCVCVCIYIHTIIANKCNLLKNNANFDSSTVCAVHV